MRARSHCVLSTPPPPEYTIDSSAQARPQFVNSTPRASCCVNLLCQPALIKLSFRRRTTGGRSSSLRSRALGVTCIETRDQPNAKRLASSILWSMLCELTNGHPVASLFNLKDSLQRRGGQTGSLRVNGVSSNFVQPLHSRVFTGSARSCRKDLTASRGRRAQGRSLVLVSLRLSRVQVWMTTPLPFCLSSHPARARVQPESMMSSTRSTAPVGNRSIVCRVPATLRACIELLAISFCSGA